MRSRSGYYREGSEGKPADREIKAKASPLKGCALQDGRIQERLKRISRGGARVAMDERGEVMGEARVYFVHSDTALEDFF